MGESGRVGLVIAAGFTFAGLLIVVHAAHRTWVSYRLTQIGRGATAQVVAFSPHSRNPVVVFAAAGTQFRITASEGPQVGDSVRVLYDPSDPNEARVDSFRALWTTNIVEAALALFLGIIPGVVTIWLIRRSTRHRVGDV